MERMFYKPEKVIVDVYNTFDETGRITALIFSMNQFKKTGNGWKKVKIGQLVPLEYCTDDLNGFRSKSDRNKIKERLTLVNPTWRATDGTQFSNIDEAIEYENVLMKKEKESDIEC